MSYLFSDLKTDVKRRGIRGQSGTEFDAASDKLINSSLFTISREAFWRMLRRQKPLDTAGELTTGTVSATNDSKTFTFSSLNPITSGVVLDRRMEVSGSGKIFIIDSIPTSSTVTTSVAFDGTTASGLTYTIFGQEEYNLPIQTGRVAFLWHEQFGFPFVMRYIPEKNFMETSIPLNAGDIPTHYRMWTQNWVQQQPIDDSVLRVTSSATADTNKSVLIYGTVSGIKTFDTNSIERVTKGSSTTGRITVDSNSAAVTVATLPVGNATAGIQYQKFRVYPYPQATFPINAMTYKDPWRLVNDNDVHELGADFDEAIVLLSVAKIKYENSQKEGDKWFAMYKDELRTLKKKNADKLDYTPTLRRPQRFGLSDRIHPQLDFSQLGGFFGPLSSGSAR
jgi:hypothetical protein